MTSTYTVKIGGSPSAPGNTYTSATPPRYVKGIGMKGDVRFRLMGLNGQAEVTEGMYVQVRYGATVVWDGFVREVQRDLGSIIREVTCQDALGELDRRDVDSRVAYSAQNEGAIGTDILSQVGITGATSPIRTGTMNAGNVLATHRVQYANSLKAMQALASIYGRELAAEYDAASGTTKVHMRAKTGDYNVSQATWRAARDLIGQPILQRDNWEQLDNARVLGQGSGVDSNDTYGASSGAGGTNRAVVPAKNLNDSGVAGAYAATLKSAFNDPRLVVVAPLRFYNLEVDQGIGLGDRVTIQDYAGVGIGDFRVVAIETNPLGTEGWFTRVTLVRATTGGGADYPLLPVVADGQGDTIPGLADQDALLNDPQTYQQETDTAPVILQPSTTQLTKGSDTVVAAGSPGTEVASTTPAADFGKAMAFWFDIQFRINAGTDPAAAAHTHDLQNHTHTLTYDSGATDSFGDTYDRTNSPTDGPTPNVTGGASASGVTIMGPFVLHIVFVDSSATEYEVAAIPLWYLVTGKTIRATPCYPFGWRKAFTSSDFSPSSIKLKVENHGGSAVTVDHTVTKVDVYPATLLRFNTGLTTL